MGAAVRRGARAQYAAPVLLLALAACAGPLPATYDRCDPRSLGASEVRARPLLCQDEMLNGGEARMGDWLLENNRIRLVLRSPFASLTELGEEGGTLIDASPAGGWDLVAELRVDGDRSGIQGVNGPGWAELRLPGMTWHLDANSDHAELREGTAVAASSVALTEDLVFDAEAEPMPPREGGFTGRLLALPGVDRTGATLQDGSRWFGTDARPAPTGAAAVPFEALSRVSIDPADTWPEGVPARQGARAPVVRVELYGQPLTRVVPVDGVVDAAFPPGATLQGESPGCVWQGVAEATCGSLHLQVRGDDGTRVVSTLGDGEGAWVVRQDGGTLDVGPFPRDMEVYAGPAWSIAPVRYHGGDDEALVTLRREIDTSGVALVDLALPAALDPVTATPAWTALHAATGRGVDYAVLVADDEVPWNIRYTHDTVWSWAGSVTAGWLWSWPWTPTNKKAGHGAVDWIGLGALDQLAVARGGGGTDRTTVVRPEWVEAARAEAPAWQWSPRPDALWLDDLGDLPTYLELLRDWVPVAPVGPVTWADVGAARNPPAVEASLLDGAVTAGNGPRLEVVVTPLRENGRRGQEPLRVAVTVDAARWMQVSAVELWTDRSHQVEPVAGEGTVVFEVPGSVAWIVATAHGEVTRPPWLDAPAWAVRGAVWVETTDPGAGP